MDVFNHAVTRAQETLRLCSKQLPPRGVPRPLTKRSEALNTDALDSLSKAHHELYNLTEATLKEKADSTLSARVDRLRRLCAYCADIAARAEHEMQQKHDVAVSSLRQLAEHSVPDLFIYITDENCGDLHLDLENSGAYVPSELKARLEYVQARELQLRVARSCLVDANGWIHKLRAFEAKLRTYGIDTLLDDAACETLKGCVLSLFSVVVLVLSGLFLFREGQFTIEVFVCVAMVESLTTVAVLNATL